MTQLSHFCAFWKESLRFKLLLLHVRFSLYYFNSRKSWTLFLSIFLTEETTAWKIIKNTEVRRIHREGKETFTIVIFIEEEFENEFKLYLILVGWWLLYNIDLIYAIHQGELTIRVVMSPPSEPLCSLPSFPTWLS